MSRKDARAMWGKVRAGLLDAQTVAWLSDVADKVLTADKMKVGNDRSSALALATGISGRAEVQDGIVFSILCLEDVLGTGPKPASAARDRLVALHGWQGSNEAIDKRLDRAIAAVDDPEMRAKLRAIIGRQARPIPARHQ